MQVSGVRRQVALAAIIKCLPLGDPAARNRTTARIASWLAPLPRSRTATLSPAGDMVRQHKSQPFPNAYRRGDPTVSAETPAVPRRARGHPAECGPGPVGTVEERAEQFAGQQRHFNMRERLGQVPCQVLPRCPRHRTHPRSCRLLHPDAAYAGRAQALWD